MENVQGIDELLQVLTKIGEGQKIEGAIEKSCAIVERSAKEKAAKKSGALKRSIESKIDTSGGEVKGIVYSNLEYAPYIEYGTGIFAESGGRQDAWSYEDDNGEWHTTRGQKPQPFMRPALQENIRDIEKLLKEALFND